MLCQPLAFTTIALKGTGTVGAVVKVSPTSLYFGANGYVGCGNTAAAQMVTVTNNSNAQITVNAALNLGANSPYTVSPASGTAAANGGSLVVTVTPKAIPPTSSTAYDLYADTLVITTTAVGDAPHNVALHETAYGAILAFTKGTINFPSTVVGQSTSVNGNFRVVNTGNAASAYTLALTDANDFSVAPTGSTVLANNFVASVATFAPKSAKALSSSVSVATNTPLCGALPAPLVLNGTGK